MYIEHMLSKNKLIYSIGKKIIKNTEYRNVFYNTPPIIYKNYESEQTILLKKFIKENNSLNIYWENNKEHMFLYFLRDYGSSKINLEK